MTGYTVPDQIQYPNGYVGVPADVPNDMQQLAEDVQIALNLKAPVAPTTDRVSLATDWAHNTGVSYGAWEVHRFGRLVVSSGTIVRFSSSLAVTDNVRVVLGTIPAGFRPYYSIRAAAAWSARDTNNVTHLSAGQLDILTSGEVGFYPNFTGTMVLQSHYISLAALSWVTP